MQVRELNLLRESNAELREENRRNFEDCRVREILLVFCSGDIDAFKLVLILSSCKT